MKTLFLILIILLWGWLLIEGLDSILTEWEKEERGD